VKWIAGFATIAAPLLLSGCLLDTILTDVLEINKAPVAVIDAAPTEGNAPHTVTLDARYSHDDDGAIARVTWDFGDPAAVASSAENRCQHTYLNSGTYVVTLTVIDEAGAIDSQQVVIVVSNAPPNAHASVSNASPYPGEDVSFSASGSSDLDGGIVSYHWDFGDGNTADGITVLHSYFQAGYYVVTLTITDDEGATAIERLNMDVRSPVTPNPPPSGGGSESYVKAVVSGLPSSCGAPASVGDPITLDGTYSFSDGSPIVSYFWELGDGTTATGPIVTHIYSRPYAYAVRLTVTTEDGCTDTCQAACSVGPVTCP
jgi:PKD repeat protein